MHLHLLLFVDIDIHDYLVLILRVISLVDDDLCILKALIVEVAFCQRFGAVDDVRSNLSSLDHADFTLQILTFRLLHAVIDNV